MGYHGFWSQLKPSSFCLPSLAWWPTYIFLIPHLPASLPLTRYYSKVWLSPHLYRTLPPPILWFPILYQSTSFVTLVDSGIGCFKVGDFKQLRPNSKVISRDTKPCPTCWKSHYISLGSQCGIMYINQAQVCHMARVGYKGMLMSPSQKMRCC